MNWTREFIRKKRGIAYEGFGAGIFAELGLQLIVGGVGDLHDAVSYDTRNDGTRGGEGEEEGPRIPCPPH